jgi:hypothetical protein
MDINAQLSHESAIMESNLFLNNAHQQRNSLSNHVAYDSKEHTEEEEPAKKGNIKKDAGTIVFLTYMYFLQGIPLGFFCLL